MEGAMTDHDGLYHLLYAHPEMVTELLQGFVAEPWLAELDLARMERINAKFHAESGLRRDGDIVWRIPMRDGRDAFLVVFVEFQSTADRFMALRLLVYIGLFWQQLLQEGRVAPNGLLPPVFPVVLFNGDPRWTVSLSLKELIGLPPGSPIWPWQPEMRYHIIDEGAYAPADLAARDSLTALLFRLEHHDQRRIDDAQLRCHVNRRLGSRARPTSSAAEARPSLKMKAFSHKPLRDLAFPEYTHCYAIRPHRSSRNSEIAACVASPTVKPVAVRGAVCDYSGRGSGHCEVPEGASETGLCRGDAGRRCADRVPVSFRRDFPAEHHLA
jgi:hypothetical protein